LERDADTKVPTRVINTDIDAMIAPMTSNIQPSPVNIIVTVIYMIDRQTVKFFVTVVIEESYEVQRKPRYAFVFLL
jgi:hypothetical protein